MSSNEVYYLLLKNIEEKIALILQKSKSYFVPLLKDKIWRWQ